MQSPNSVPDELLVTESQNGCLLTGGPSCSNHNIILKQDNNGNSNHKFIIPVIEFDNQDSKVEHQQEDSKVEHCEERQLDRQQSQRTHTTPVISSTAAIPSNGYYDAEKCRAYIANQIRVSKIDRFAAQVNKAIEIETGFQIRLANIMNMFLKRSAQVVHEFTLRCQLGLKRHRQDRILNHQQHNHKLVIKKGRRRLTIRTRTKGHLQASPSDYIINDRICSAVPLSNDLFYGQGAQLINELLNQPMDSKDLYATGERKSISATHAGNRNYTIDEPEKKLNLDIDQLDCSQFEPSLFVKKLQNLIQLNESQSIILTRQLNRTKQLFESLASDHRNKVDLVYAAEENRQATTVIRRSAYNLSMAAFKATSTPIHVNLINPHQSNS